MLIRELKVFYLKFKSLVICYCMFSVTTDLMRLLVTDREIYDSKVKLKKMVKILSGRILSGGEQLYY